MIYQIYNYKVNSNIVLEHLIYSKNQSAFDINLKFNVGDIDSNRYCECMISQDYYILNLYNIIYKINKLGNQIEVYCRDLEFFTLLATTYHFQLFLILIKTYFYIQVR